MGENITEIKAEPGMQSIVITREFDAPRPAVFRAHTDKDIYSQWNGPRGYATEVLKFEPWDGGSYRFISKDKDGNEFEFHGVYHEVARPERIIGTFEFDGLPEKGHVELDFAKFEELPGKRTRLTVTAVYQSIADRDQMIASGMETGVKEGYERLEEFLAR